MNRENLRILADYLLGGKLKARFDMAIYAAPPWDSSDTNCGTIGCAAGHGPYAGVPKRASECWPEYIERQFDLTPIEYSWCFSGDWEAHDNTPEGAGNRILYLIEHGCTPARFHQRQQEHFPAGCNLSNEPPGAPNAGNKEPPP